jgi:hypothetical protein
MDISIWFRWAIGGIVGLLATMLLFVINGVNEHNIRQDEQIVDIQKDNQQRAIQQEQVFRELSSQNADTAKILEGVVRKLEAIDERGSRALTEHESNLHRSEQ